MNGDSLQKAIMEGRLERKRERGRPRRTLMDRMMEDRYWEVEEKAQHREECSRWTFGPAERHLTLRRRRNM